MRRALFLGIGAAGLAGLGALGGCEIVTVAALNLVETTEFRVEGTTAYMNGEINSKTLDQFEELVAANPGLTTIVECNVPGSLDDDTMIPLSYRVRELGLNTHLTATSEIASGGVDFFLAGVGRTMMPGAQLGVHSWSDGISDAIDYPRDAPEHEANRAYIEQMLGDDAFYWFTIEAAPAADIYWMTEAEIVQYGLLTAPLGEVSQTFDCTPHFGAPD